MSGVRYDDKKKKKILRLYVDKELSAAAIARLGNMPTEKTIRRILTEQGVRLRGNPRQYDRQAIERDLEDMSVSQVAKKHGCSQRFIYKMKREAQDN